MPKLVREHESFDADSRGILELLSLRENERECPGAALHDLVRSTECIAGRKREPLPRFSSKGKMCCRTVHRASVKRSTNKS